MCNINQKFISTNLPKTLEEWVSSERGSAPLHLNRLAFGCIITLVKPLKIADMMGKNLLLKAKAKKKKKENWLSFVYLTNCKHSLNTLTINPLISLIPYLVFPQPTSEAMQLASNTQERKTKELQTPKKKKICKKLFYSWASKALLLACW